MYKIWTFCAFLILSACASTTEQRAPKEINLSQLSHYVRGQLVHQNGTPVKAATVYFSRQINSKKAITEYQLGSISIGSNACAAPPVPYYSFTCTDSNGRFHLHFLGALNSPLQLHFSQKNLNVTMRLGNQQMSSDIGTIVFRPPQLVKNKIAIVMDLFNPMEQISNMGSEALEYNAVFLDYFFDHYSLSKMENELTFPALGSLFLDQDGDNKIDIYQYKTVFINSRGEKDMQKLSNKEKTLLLEYVSNGGELLITNWSLKTLQAKFENYI